MIKIKNGTESDKQRLLSEYPNFDNFFLRWRAACPA